MSDAGMTTDASEAPTPSPVSSLETRPTRRRRTRPPRVEVLDYTGQRNTPDYSISRNTPDYTVNRATPEYTGNDRPGYMSGQESEANNGNLTDSSIQAGGILFKVQTLSALLLGEGPCFPLSGFSDKRETDFKTLLKHKPGDFV